MTRPTALFSTLSTPDRLTFVGRAWASARRRPLRDIIGCIIEREPRLWNEWTTMGPRAWPYPLTGTPWFASSTAADARHRCAHHHQGDRKDGKPVKAYTVLHDNELHLIVVRHDLTGYQLRPSDGAPSLYLERAAASSSDEGRSWSPKAFVSRPHEVRRARYGLMVIDLDSPRARHQAGHHPRRLVPASPAQLDDFAGPARRPAGPRQQCGPQ